MRRFSHLVAQPRFARLWSIRQETPRIEWLECSWVFPFVEGRSPMGQPVPVTLTTKWIRMRDVNSVVDLWRPSDTKLYKSRVTAKRFKAFPTLIAIAVPYSKCNVGCPRRCSLA